MSGEWFSLMGILVAFTTWQLIAYARSLHAAQKQCEIALRGAHCTGKVVAIQRPFLLDAHARLYFDFLPDGCDRPLRACHLARQPHGERALLPTTGSLVEVRYLPERPTDAVIAQLISAAPQ